MSLKIWLPLNGTLDNLGTDNLTVTNSGATVNDNGKIGKCYYFTGNQMSFTAPSWACMLPANNFSLFCWLKGAPASSWLFAEGAWEARFRPTQIGVSISNNGQYPAFASGTYSATQWYHFGFTWDGATGMLRVYLDGTQVASSTVPSSASYQIGSTFKMTYSSGYYLNDFRIYDHCLSDAEIHELSMALVCHYKLDRIGQEGNNLVTGLTAGGRTTISNNNTVTTAGENSDTYFTINLSESIVVGQRYTLSCNASNVASGYKWRFPLGAQANTSLPFFIDNGYNEYTFVANDISWGSNRIFMDDSNTSNNVRLSQAVFTDFRLYKADTIIDSSGYGYNGTISGTITESSDTARYTGSLSFDGSSYIQHPYAIGETAAEQEWTCCTWVKPSAVASYANVNNFNLGNKINHGGRPILYLNGGTNDYYMYGATGYPVLNEWQHFAFVFRNSDGLRKIYVNGVDISASGPNKTSTPSGILKTIQIGEGITGLLADYREYATALSADDVKKLYALGMKVDNTQDVHGFEFDEIQTNLINKSTNTLGYIGSNGAIQSHTAWYVTDYIPVTYGKKYLGVGLTTANSGNVYNAFYNSSKTFTRAVLDSTDYEQLIVPNSGDAYVRLSLRNADGVNEAYTAGLYEIIAPGVSRKYCFSTLVNEETKAAIYEQGSYHAKEFLEI